MLVSENWLRQLANPDMDREALSHKLTMAGLEVEDVQALPRLDDSIVVARIARIEPHPVKVKLKICFITIDEIKEIQVVCGAPNAREGLLTAFAQAGSIMPGGQAIGETELAGVVSYGMLCSEQELGISDEHSGIMELDPSLQPGMSLNKAVDLPDAVIEIDLTPNRGDCLSMLGVARDLSAITGCTLNYQEPDSVAPTLDEAVSVIVQAPEACPRYCGRIISGVDVNAPVPEWMKQRLNRGGMRSVGNAVVDVTNYVQLELGQPMHGFDLARINGGIRVKKASEKMPFAGIDGKQYTIEPDTLLIADDHDVLAVAGIMGGSNSAVSEQTRDIVLESAYFTPDSVAGRARKMGLHTESSHRFERGVDPHGQMRAMQYATALVLDICGGSAGKIVDVLHKESLPTSCNIKVDRKEVARILGYRLADDAVEDIFRRLQFQSETTDAGWRVVPPSWRQDVRLQCDVIEEIIRLHGYENIPTHVAHGPLRISVARESQLPDQRIRDLLCDAGYFEAITYSFVEKDVQNRLNPDVEAVAVANPIASDMSVMRTSLWTGLLGALSRNVKRQYDSVRLFETGNVFTGKNGNFRQFESIGGVATGRVSARSWNGADREIDFFDVKGVVEALLDLGKKTDVAFRPLQHPALHTGQAAEVLVGDEVVGKLGRLHPVLQKSLGFPMPVYLFEMEAGKVKAKAVAEFSALSQFPPVKRDLAVVVDKTVSFDDVRRLILQTSSKLLSKLELFDVYVGNNVDFDRKSLGFSLTFQASSRTLNDTEVDDQMNMVVSALQKDFGAEIRK